MADDDEMLPDVPDLSKLPVGKWTGAEGLSADLSSPHGRQAITADKRPDTLAYLPNAPHLLDTGGYVYAAAVYPIVEMKVSLWEYYHSQSDINLCPHTYITDYCPLEVFGTRFHDAKESHRLHWHSDRDALIQFLGFLQTLILKQDAKRRIWSLALHEIQVPYPKVNDSNYTITCVVILPYSHQGAFVPSSELGIHGRPVIKWVSTDTCAEFAKWRAVQDDRRAAAMKKGYAGELPQPDESYPFHKAPEIKTTIELLWGDA